MYYFHEHYYLWLFCFHLENVGECCKAQGVCVHQRIALYKSYYYYCFSRHCICKFWQVFETPDVSHSQITLSFLFKGEEPCDELLIYFAFLFWFTEDVVWGHIFRLFVSFYCIAHVYNRVSFSFCSVVHDIWWVCVCMCVCEHINSTTWFKWATSLFDMYLFILRIFSTTVLWVLKYAICVIVYCDVVYV